MAGLWEGDLAGDWEEFRERGFKPDWEGDLEAGCGVGFGAGPRDACWT